MNLTGGLCPCLARGTGHQLSSDISPCTSDARGVIASVPASCMGFRSTLQLCLHPCLWSILLFPLDEHTGPMSSVPFSGVVDGAWCHHLALLTMLGPHGRVPHQWGHSLHCGFCQPQAPHPLQGALLLLCTKENSAKKHTRQPTFGFTYNTSSLQARTRSSCDKQSFSRIPGYIGTAPGTRGILKSFFFFFSYSSIS